MFQTKTDIEKSDRRLYDSSKNLSLLSRAKHPGQGILWTILQPRTELRSHFEALVESQRTYSQYSFTDEDRVFQMQTLTIIVSFSAWVFTHHGK